MKHDAFCELRRTKPPGVVLWPQRGTCYCGLRASLKRLAQVGEDMARAYAEAMARVGINLRAAIEKAREERERDG